MSIVCDLILLSWNHLEQTTPCLESLFAFTDVPCRLLIVDNGSEPPVREFLRSVAPHGQIREVVLLQNEVNEGFPGGMNRGLRASHAPYACLLNNDLVFTAGWLSGLLAVARAHPNIGVLNPSSSTFGEYPPKGMSLEAYARQREVRPGRYVEVGMCIGFCFLIPRAVIDRIGVLTDEVERIFFEDEDYSMRVAAAGLRCVVVESSYVYHAENQTMRKVPQREALFARNRQWCEAKWGRRVRIAHPVFSRLEPGTPQLRQLLERLTRWARNRSRVYVYYAAVPGFDGRALFESVGLVPHSDVSWYPLPARGARLAAAWVVIKRRKKPFDAVIAPDDRWAAWMRRLKGMHSARVLRDTDTQEVRRLWKIEFPSPLSS